MPRYRFYFSVGGYLENVKHWSAGSQFNVNIETIRYYERRELLPAPPRNTSGHRQYSNEAVQRTDFIKRAQSLGFSLNEISELLTFL